MMSHPESRYRVRKYLVNQDKLDYSKTYWCRCHTNWGRGNMKTPHRMNQIDGVLEHRTVCVHPGHLTDIKRLYFADLAKEVDASKEMKERRANISYWENLDKAKHKRAKHYAWKYGVSHQQALFEIEVLDTIAKEEADAVWREAEPYIPKSNSEEE
jgi:hypothetical protein